MTVPYIEPMQVTAGIDGAPVEIIHDSKEGGHALAIVMKDGCRLFARRWNGDATKPKGFPNSYNRPTWDFLSDEEGIVLSAFYRAKKVAENDAKVAEITARVNENRTIMREATA